MILPVVDRAAGLFPYGATGRLLGRIVLFCLVLLPWSQAVMAGNSDLIPMTVSVPGPRNLSYLPVDLIPMIGADRAEGVKLTLTHTGGGGVALEHMATGKSDCAVAGMPAHLSLRINDQGVVTLAAVNDAPLFVLVVRAGLAGRVRTPADLKGRVIGVNAGSLVSKTTSQQLAELVLKNDGLEPGDVKIVPVGQDWEQQSSAIENGKVDAIMGDEPFASRLLHEGKVFFLVNLADPSTTRRLPGSNFLHAALACRPDMVAREPDKARRMVAIIRRALVWIAGHTPGEVVATLGILNPEEKNSLIDALKKHPHAFSKDGKFSTRQLQETQLFFRTANSQNALARALVIENSVDDRWAGRRD
ncbi:MAG: ABC transporter substrate-binding protein [Magnetococcales bacterium]|nr:ABC transporter substrate-binding protein [Magnetococcales bacterium]